MTVSSPSSTLRRSLFLLAVLGSAALWLAACADDPKNTEDDTTDTTGGGDTTGGDGGEDTTDPGDTTIDPDVPMGTILVEPADEFNEFRDCLADCAHEDPSFIWDWQNGAGLQGVIDDRCHALEGIAFGSDVDWVGLRAAPRTMVEIKVQPTSGSLMNPLIQLSNGLFVMTFSDDEGPGTVTARTLIAGQTADVPFYVEIHHYDNYWALDPGATSCEGFVGGSDYGYVMTVEEIPFEPVELGDLTVGASASGSGTVTAPGDITYFRFTAPATATPTVTLTRTGNSEFLMHAAGMNTIQGQMAWNAPKSDEGGAGTLTLGPTDFDVCFSDCDGATGEFFFAVTDWNGWGGSDYSYNVQVQL